MLALVNHLLVGAETGKAKKRKQALNVDNPDVEWFSTPPLSDGNLGVEEGTSGTQAATGGPNPTYSSEQLLTPPADAEIGNVAGPSTSATASVGLTSSRKSPLTTGEGRGAATYAYRAAPFRERSSPVDPTSIPEFSSAAHSAIPPIPVPSTSRQQLPGRNAALPSGGPSEARNCSETSEGPPSSKQKSNRKRKREKSKEAASSAAAMPPVTTDTPTPNKNTPTTPTTVEDKDMHTEQGTVAQLGGQQAGPNENFEGTGEIVNAEPILDDSLNMRAGLVVNGVTFFAMRKHRILTTSLSQWPYTALSEIIPSVLTSIIGVVSFIAKEPRQTQKGGMGAFPEIAFATHDLPLRLVHLHFFTGSLCPGRVWWRSFRERCRH